MIQSIHEVHMIITGFVQGVGYRSWTKQKAQNAGIVGWVKNLDDGTVEILAHGEKDILKSFIHTCRKGPLASHVEKIDARWREVDSIKYTSFDVIY